MKNKSNFKLLLVAILLSIHQAEACLDSEPAYGDTFDSSTSYSDYDNLIVNYRDGMRVETVKACQNVLG